MRGLSALYGSWKINCILRRKSSSSRILPEHARRSLRHRRVLDFTAVRSHRAHDDFAQRGLAATALADQAETFAALDVEGTRRRRAVRATAQPNQLPECRWKVLLILARAGAAPVRFAAVSVLAAFFRQSARRLPSRSRAPAPGARRVRGQSAAPRASMPSGNRVADLRTGTAAGPLP